MKGRQFEAIECSREGDPHGGSERLWTGSGVGQRAVRAVLAVARPRADWSAAHGRGVLSRYDRWGAKAKVKDIEARYPQLFTGAGPESGAGGLALSTIISGSESFDLNTVLKASQVISSEIVLDQLVEQLMPNCARERRGPRRPYIDSRGEQRGQPGSRTVRSPARSWPSAMPVAPRQRPSCPAAHGRELRATDVRESRRRRRRDRPPVRRRPLCGPESSTLYSSVSPCSIRDGDRACCIWKTTWPRTRSSTTAFKSCT